MEQRMKTELLRLEHVFAPPELSDLNMDIYEGEITALIGLDYIGIDYMLNLIRCNLPIRYGRIFFRGERINDQYIRRKQPNKIAFIGRQPALIDSLSVAENIFVIRSGYRKRYINYRHIKQQARNILALFGLTLDPALRTETLSLYEKWIVELAKAWVSGIRLIIMRDISHFITAEELTQMISVINFLCKNGRGILYLCNHHQEAFRLCSRCFLMKRGRIVKRFEKDEMTENGIAHFITGFEKWAHNTERGKLFLSDTESGTEGFFCRMGDLQFSIKKGETLVLLDSNSRTIDRLFDLLHSRKMPDGVILRINGKPHRAGSRDCVTIPHQPVSTFLFPHLSVLDNLCFTLDHKLRSFRSMKQIKRAVADDLYPLLGEAVYAQSLDDLTERQLYDIIYQRILIQNPSFICVMQPLASVDQAMRLRLLSYFDSFRAKGITVCIPCFMLADSLEIADRLLVIKDGKIDRESLRSDFSAYPGVSGSRPVHYP